ncbi:MAG: carboxypeptidase regulatory-like domain-containing protein [Acidobacteria bacterium]|nr:carboxypeptidase regulatory-like domain-containing protein [Acidobacteriota bacterium]
MRKYVQVGGGAGSSDSGPIAPPEELRDASSLQVRNKESSISIAGDIAPAVEIIGRVITPDGAGIRNAAVSLTDTRGSVRTVMTGPLGYYRFEGVTRGEAFTLTVDSRRFQFDPVSVISGTRGRRLIFGLVNDRAVGKRDGINSFGEQHDVAPLIGVRDDYLFAVPRPVKPESVSLGNVPYDGGLATIFRHNEKIDRVTFVKDLSEGSAVGVPTHAAFGDRFRKSQFV